MTGNYRKARDHTVLTSCQSVRGPWRLASRDETVATIEPFYFIINHFCVFSPRFAPPCGACTLSLCAVLSVPTRPSPIP